MSSGSGSRLVTSRRVGEAVITAISEGTILFPPSEVLDVPEAEWRPYVPNADAEGRALFDHLAFHVRLPEASILIDAGMDDPPSSPSQEKWVQMGLRRTAGLRAGLEQIGVSPEDISHVLLTHAHWDHVLGVTADRDGARVPRFPNARYYLGRGDWTRVEEQAWGADVVGRLQAVERHGLLEVVDGDREVLPGVTMIHAPGESPGHSVVRIESAGESFYALGDLVHHPVEVAHPSWSRQADDHAALQRSRQRVMAEAAARGAVVAFSHAPSPPWGRIMRQGEGYCWEPEP